MEKSTPITKESLIVFGMKELQDPRVSMKKILCKSDKGEITILVTYYYNVPQICLSIPEGMIYLNVSSIEELQAFEKCIGSYESNY